MSGKLQRDFSVLSNSVFIQAERVRAVSVCGNVSEMVDDCSVRYKWAESEHI